jgi:hypothetical protein
VGSGLSEANHVVSFRIVIGTINVDRQLLFAMSADESPLVWSEIGWRVAAKYAHATCWTVDHVEQFARIREQFNLKFTRHPFPEPLYSSPALLLALVRVGITHFFHKDLLQFQKAELNQILA